MPKSAQLSSTMEIEVEVSLVGDGGYSKALANVPVKGEGRKRYTNLVLGLVREVEKEDEEKEEGVDLKRN